MPFTVTVGDIPTIAYLICTRQSNDATELLHSQDDAVKWLEELYTEHSFVRVGEYHIVFLWRIETVLMTDVFVHHRIFSNTDAGGHAIEPHVFKQKTVCKATGVASRYSLITLGREQEHSCRFDTVADYVDRDASLPSFPEGFLVQQRPWQ